MAKIKEDEKILIEGFKGEQFKNREEARKYLESLNDKDFLKTYIEEAVETDQTRIAKKDALLKISHCIIAIAAGILALSLISCFFSMSFAFKLFKTLCFSFLGCAGVEQFFLKYYEYEAKQNITSKLNVYKNDLESFLEAAEQLKIPLQTFEKEGGKKYETVDTYIKDIGSLIAKIDYLKYEGYKTDMKTLYLLGQEFLEKKKAMKETSEVAVLYKYSDLIKKLQNLEMEVAKKEATAIDRRVNEAKMDELGEILLKNGISIPDFVEEVVDSEPDSDPSLRLNL